MTQFIAIDGEGRNRGKQHDYYLMCASTGGYIESKRQLSTFQCLDFLLECGKSDAVLVGFGLGYDFTKILEDIPDSALLRLFHKDTIGIRDTDTGKEYILQLVVGKWLKINKTIVFDVFSFFQKSFVRALEEWKITTADKADAILAMKQQRGQFDKVDNDTIRSYCFSECELLVQLMEAFEQSIEPLGIELTSWHGPGALAKAMLKNQDMNQYRRVGYERIPERNRIFRSAYYGGRFETIDIGWIGKHARTHTATERETAWQNRDRQSTADQLYDYDINSAYPYATSMLPCIACGRWRNSNVYNPQYLGMWHVRFSRGNGHYPGSLADPYKLGPFPFRFPNGTIVYPNHGEGWYWTFEVQVALTMTDLTIDILEGIYYEPHCDHAPFNWIPELYRLRAELKRAGNIAHISYKLVYNSIYGAFAQRQFEDGRTPYWQTYAWAGMITSRCRAQILAACLQDEDSIISIATDGILCSRPLDLPVSDQLGQWEHHTYDAGFIAQSGIMMLQKDENIIYKTRGNSPDEIDWPELMRRFDDMGPIASIAYKTTRFMGIGLSAHRKKPRDFYGRWIPQEHNLSLWPSRRQLAPGGRDWPRYAHTTLPYMMALPRISAPYKQADEDIADVFEYA